MSGSVDSGDLLGGDLGRWAMAVCVVAAVLPPPHSSRSGHRRRVGPQIRFGLSECLAIVRPLQQR
jgi:hypothetical protein